MTEYAQWRIDRNLYRTEGYIYIFIIPKIRVVPPPTNIIHKKGHGEGEGGIHPLYSPRIYDHGLSLQGKCTVLTRHLTNHCSNIIDDDVDVTRRR